MCTWVNKHLCISYLCPGRGPRGNGTLAAMITPSTQILVSKYLSPIKGTWTSWRSGCSRAGAGKTQDEPGVSMVPQSKQDEGMLKRQEALNGQSQRNLNSKK